MGIGLHEMSVILLATGAFMIILATIGCCAGVGRRKWAMQFFSGILLIETVYQTGLGILTLIQRGKVIITLQCFDNSFIVCFSLKIIWILHGMT